MKRIYLEAGRSRRFASAVIQRHGVRGLGEEQPALDVDPEQAPPMPRRSAQGIPATARPMTSSTTGTRSPPRERSAAALPRACGRSHSPSRAAGSSPRCAALPAHAPCRWRRGRSRSRSWRSGAPHRCTASSPASPRGRPPRTRMRDRAAAHRPAPTAASHTAPEYSDSSRKFGSTKPLCHCRIGFSDGVDHRLRRHGRQRRTAPPAGRAPSVGPAEPPCCGERQARAGW